MHDPGDRISNTAIIGSYTELSNNVRINVSVGTGSVIEHNVSVGNGVRIH